jgi:hypothetical protein
LVVPLFFVVLAMLQNYAFFSLTLASVMVVLLYVRYSRICFGISSSSLLKRVVICVALLLLVVEVASFAGSLLLNSPIASALSPQLNKSAWSWVFLDLSFSNVVYPLLPLAYLVFIVLGVLGVFAKIDVWARFFEKPRVRGFLHRASRIKRILDVGKKEYSPLPHSRLVLVIAIFVSIAISSVLVVITVLPWINPSFRLVGADAPLYYKWIQGLRANDFNGALSVAFASDRSVFLIGLYFMSAVIPPLYLVQFLAILLIPLFSVLSLLLVKHVGGSYEASIFTVLLAPLSIQALGLIYSGYFAQMFATILVYVYYLLFLNVLRKGSSLSIFASVGVSVLVLFTHPWTWFIFALSLLTYLLMQWRFASLQNRELWRNFKTKVTLVIVTLLVSLLCDFVRQILTSASSVGVVYDTVRGTLAFPNLSLLWSGLKVTSVFYLGGVFGSQLLVLLSIVGFLFMLTRKSDISVFLVSWVFVASVSILFTSSEFAYHRFLFSMPLGVFSGLGLSYLMRLMVYQSGSSKRRNFGAAMLFFVVVFLMLLNSALRFVSNIYVF